MGETTVEPPLTGVRVVDLSRVLAGPYAAQLLAELGAEVIKVEPPEGDPARGIGPFVAGRSVYFGALNAGKHGIVLDLTIPQNRATLDVLLADADIVVTNLRPHAAARLGCQPERLLADHPQLGVLSIPGYASASDRAEEAALDLSVQAESGIMAVTGDPGGPPARAGVPLGDLAAGVLGALGAVAGYTARLRGGRGRVVEVPLLDAAVAMLSYVGAAALATGTEPGRVGSGHHTVVPYGAYPTADGWLAVAVIGDKLWGLLCHALDLDGLAGRADLASGEGRSRALAEVDRAVTARLATLPTAIAQQRLSAAGVPCAPVNTVLDALASPYVHARGIVQQAAQSDGAGYKVLRSPLRRGAGLSAAPDLGQHTTEILATLPRATPGVDVGTDEML